MLNNKKETNLAAKLAQGHHRQTVLPGRFFEKS